MKELEVRIRELELKVDDLAAQHERVKENIDSHLDENDIRALLDQLILEKEYITRSELEEKTTKNQLQIIKWMIGIGFSCVALLFGLIKYFI